MPPSNSPSSFIPHEAPRARSQQSSGGAVDLMMLVAIVLLVTSIALAAGAFVYKQYLEADGASKVDQLKRAKAAFEPTLIQELTRLDDRMRITGDLLAKHEAISAFFRMLQQSTVQTISFSTLHIEAQPGQPIVLKMEGMAQSVNSIALQADLFGKGGIVTNAIFSDINRSLTGVRFSFSGQLNQSAITYGQNSSVQSPLIPAAPSLPADNTNTKPSEGSPFGNSGGDTEAQ